MSKNQIIRISALIIFGVLMYLVRGAMLPVVIAIVLYYILHPLVSRLSDKRINKDVSIIISFIILILVLIAAWQFIFPPLADEFSQLANNAPKYMSDINAFFNSIAAWQAAVHIPKEINDQISSVLQSFLEYMVVFAQFGTSALFGLLSRSVYIVIMPIITYFMLRDDNNIVKGMVDMLPGSQKDVTLRVITKVDDVFKNYVTGQVILCSAVGLMCGVGLFILGVRFALILGLVAAIAQLIPNIGPLIATVPALMIAAVASPVLALKVLVLYVLINILMISILGPKVLGDKLNLHPLTVVISILVFGELMGVWGFFFAAPIVATLKILYLELRNP